MSSGNEESRHGAKLKRCNEAFKRSVEVSHGCSTVQLSSSKFYLMFSSIARANGKTFSTVALFEMLFCARGTRGVRNPEKNKQMKIAFALASEAWKSAPV